MATNASDVRNAVRHLAAALLDEVERIASCSVARMQEMLPSYAKVPADELMPILLANTRNLLEAVGTSKPDSARHERAFQQSGEIRLRQGISADEMLQAWRIGLEVVREEAHTMAARLKVSAADLLEFVDASLRWGDIGMRRSAAAHRAGELQELERLAAEQASLRRVATMVARERAPGEVFSTVAEELSRLLDMTMVRLVRFEPDGTATLLASHQPAEDLLPVGTNTPLPRGTVIERIFATGRPASVEDYSQVDGPIGQLLRQEGVRRAVGAPVVVDGRLWGAMVVGTSSAWKSDDTKERLAQFAELVSMAISNIESRASVERLAAEQSALRRVAELVARQAPPEQVFRLVTEELNRLLDVTNVGTVRFESDGTATVMAVSGTAQDTFPPGTGVPLEDGSVIEQVFHTGRPALAENYNKVAGRLGSVVRDLGAGWAAAGPIVVEGRLWGAMVVNSLKAENYPPGAENRVAQFAALISTAISNVESRAKVEQLVAEQSALRRVATVVAHERPSDEILASLAEEIGVLFDADASAVLRYESDLNLTVVARWGKRPIGRPVGQRFPLEAGYLAAEVLRTGMPGRKAAIVCELGIRSAVASPIFVEGAIWGTLTVISLTSEPFPPEAEARLAEFSRHAGVAVANAKTRSDLTESRARIVRTADVARKRFERDLHDGAQQRLVSLGLELCAVEMTVPPELGDVRRVLATLATGMNEVLDDLRELSRGLHPAVLSEDGLTAALSALALRSPVPVELRLAIGAERFEEAVEVAAYYVASEALTNAAKHARASRAEVRASVTDGSLQIVVRDDGQGGADASRGSGLTGLRDRVEALGGTIRIESHHDLGTAIQVRLPTTSPNT